MLYCQRVHPRGSGAGVSAHMTTRVYDHGDIRRTLMDFVEERVAHEALSSRKSQHAVMCQCSCGLALRVQSSNNRDGTRSDETPEPSRTPPNSAELRRTAERHRDTEQRRVFPHFPHRDMSFPSVRQLFLLCLLWFIGCGSRTDAGPYEEWEDGLLLRKVLRAVRSDDFSDAEWTDQDEDKVQNVFKRFLFHYSKARDSVGAVQQESHSVHPLMRLSPKLSQRRKVLLLKI
ncbi:hypothetical protein JOB18_002479 [Solea senegalensis]|uniref:Neuromedin-S n=2 Tax=Solea senegalensis TaxID=28829 RepID=A0AAV6R820_SOLSE|nr:hypothetical protein JOB18_002479 [Solea senegalensis]